MRERGQLVFPTNQSEVSILHTNEFHVRVARRRKWGRRYSRLYMYTLCIHSALYELNIPNTSIIIDTSLSITSPVAFVPMHICIYASCAIDKKELITFPDLVTNLFIIKAWEGTILYRRTRNVSSGPFRRPPTSPTSNPPAHPLASPSPSHP